MLKLATGLNAALVCCLLLIPSTSFAADISCELMKKCCEKSNGTYRGPHVDQGGNQVHCQCRNAHSLSYTICKITHKILIGDTPEQYITEEVIQSEGQLYHLMEELEE